MPVRSASSVTTTKCQCCWLTDVGAWTAISRHRVMMSSSTGLSRSRRRRTARVVVSSCSAVRSSTSAVCLAGLGLAAQESLDLAGEVVAAWQALLVDAAADRLELFDRLPEHGVRLDGGVVAGLLVALLLAQALHRDGDGEVGCDALEQGDACGGVADARVGRHLGEEADGRDA